MTPSNEHRITRYLDGNDEPAERDAFEGAAADDPRLRQQLIAHARARTKANHAPPSDELLAAARALGNAEARRGVGPSRRAWPLAAVIAVLVLGTSLLLHLNRSPTPDPHAFRSDPAVAKPIEVALLEPSTNAATEGLTIQFRWQPVAEALHYTLVIMDAEGSVLVRISTEQPGLLLDTPPSRARPFYWFVEAHRPAGSTIASEVRQWNPVSVPAPP